MFLLLLSSVVHFSSSRLPSADMLHVGTIPPPAAQFLTLKVRTGVSVTIDSLMFSLSLHARTVNA